MLTVLKFNICAFFCLISMYYTKKRENRQLKKEQSASFVSDDPAIRLKHITETQDLI